MTSRSLLLAVAFLSLQGTATDGDRWWRHVEFLAADSLEGRSIGTAGFQRAAEYVSIAISRGGADKFLAGSGHTLAELER